MSVVVPARVEVLPPSNVAVLADTLNLVCLLEQHARFVMKPGISLHSFANNTFVFYAGTALAATLWHHGHGHPNRYWELAQTLLLPTTELTVEVDLCQWGQGSGPEAVQEESAQLLRQLQMEHHDYHRRSASSPEKWTVHRDVLQKSGGLVDLPLHLLGQRPFQDRLTQGSTVVENYIDMTVRTPDVRCRFSLPDLHGIFFDLMDAIAYHRGSFHVNFFFLYLLMGHKAQLPQPPPHVPDFVRKLRMLYLADIRFQGDAYMMLDLLKRYLEPPARQELQVDWHLARPVTSGSGGTRNREQLLLEYRDVVEQALGCLMAAIAPGPVPVSSYSASSLAKRNPSSPFHPVARQHVF
ncbi:hypothetical protein JCM10213_008233 [Rhodosporidiobolus nylandii]